MRNWTACGVGVAAVSALVAPTDAAANAQEEAQKQAARLISQAIGDRIAARSDLSFDSSPGGGQDRAVWGISSFSKLDSAQDAAAGAAVDFGMNLGLLAGGYDWGVSDKVISGINTSLYFFDGDAESDAGFGVFNTQLTGVGFTAAPYIAYQVNDYFFLSGVFGAGYSTTTVDMPAMTIDLGPGLGTFTNPAQSLSSGAATFNGDLAANFVQSAGPVSFREKVLYRANYSLPDSGDEGTLSNSFGIGAEAEVKIGQNAGFYMNAESTYLLDDEAGAGTDDERYPIYVGAGINYRPSDYMQFGAGYQTEFGDDTSDISSILVTGRIKFRGGLQGADNRVTPVDNRVSPVDDYQPLYSPASSPAAPPQYQQYQPAPAAPQTASRGFQPQYQQYQQPAMQPAMQQPAFQPAVEMRGGAPAQTGATSVCETRLGQHMQMRAQAGRASPDEDARSFRAIYDDYDRCMAAAR